MGNTFGTLPTIFFLIAILSKDTTKGNYLIKLGTLSVVVFEPASPLLGKPIDIWDILATIITSLFSYLFYNLLLKRNFEIKLTVNQVKYPNSDRKPMNLSKVQSAYGNTPLQFIGIEFTLL